MTLWQEKFLNLLKNIERNRYKDIKNAYVDFVYPDIWYFNNFYFNHDYELDFIDFYLMNNDFYFVYQMIDNKLNIETNMKDSDIEILFKELNNEIIGVCDDKKN